ncbi:DUF6339 family protein [Gemmatimonadota bacterium]
MNLFPRLSTTIANELVEELRLLSIERLIAKADYRHPQSVFASTGGSRVKETQLKKLIHDLRCIAGEVGYPQKRDRNYSSRFDTEAGILLHTKMDISASEAANNQMWQFMTCVCVPDLVLWRFKPKREEGITPERFMGGNRNLLRRLWWRAEVLFDAENEDEYWILKELGEDNLVQVMERPRIYGDTRLSLTGCRIFIESFSSPIALQTRKRQDVMRDYQARILRLSPIISFQALSQDDLEALLKTELDASIEAISLQTN